MKEPVTYEEACEASKAIGDYLAARHKTKGNDIEVDQPGDGK